MGGKPRKKPMRRYEHCLCCGDSIGCRGSHTHCKQLCLVGLCEGCFDGNCVEENLFDLVDTIASEEQDYDKRRAELTQRYDELEATQKRAVQWEKDHGR
jgi:hypothetical protein